MKSHLELFVSIALILFLGTGCASIFESKTQTITVLSKTEDSVVEIGNKEYKGDSVQIQVEKKATFITNHKEGYLDETVVIYPYRRSPWIIGDVAIPLITGVIISSIYENASDAITGLTLLGFGILYLDKFERAYVFENKNVEFGALRRIPVREEGQKYLYVDNTEFDWKSGDVTFNYYPTPKDYYKSKKSSSFVESNDKSIEGEAFELSQELNEVLEKFDLTDTTESFFGNNYKSLLIDCLMDNIKVVYVEEVFVQIEMVIDWKIKDINQKELYSETITAKSDPFPVNKSDEAVLSNALKRNLLTFISNDTVSTILRNTTIDDKPLMDDWDIITLENVDTANGVNSAVKSVVTIKVNDGHGSGCIVSKDGYIVTNFHVIRGNDSVEVVFNDQTVATAKVVRTNPRADLALLKVEESCEHVLYLSADDKVDVGVDVFSIGTPANLQLGQTVSKGIVSGYREFNDLEYIQTDVKINGGNSGGALIDRKGMLIGITNAKMFGLGVEGIGFAIPVKYVFSELKIKTK